MIVWMIWGLFGGDEKENCSVVLILVLEVTEKGDSGTGIALGKVKAMKVFLLGAGRVDLGFEVGIEEFAAEVDTTELGEDVNDGGRDEDGGVGSDDDTDHDTE